MKLLMNLEIKNNILQIKLMKLKYLKEKVKLIIKIYIQKLVNKIKNHQLKNFGINYDLIIFLYIYV